MNFTEVKDIKCSPTSRFGSLLPNYCDRMDAMNILKLLGAFENDAGRGIGIYLCFK